MRVLYLHPFGVFGGSTKSLAEMVAALPAGSVEGVVIAPPGVAADALTKAGLEVISVWGMPQWNDTRASYYHGARWLVLLRELAFWPATLEALNKARKLGRFDVIHCNEITALPVAVAAHRLLGVPLVVHARSLQRGDEGGIVTSWVMDTVRKNATEVIAIDEAVRRTLPNDIPMTVIHNGMKVPAEPAVLDDTQPFTIGSIGVLHPAKGLFELFEAGRILKERAHDFRFVIAGENIRPVGGLKGLLMKKLDFSRDVRAELEERATRYGFMDRVEFTGFVSDVASVYRRLHALCFASHLDAPGRPVFEAALFGLPAIVAMEDPTVDVIEDGVTGVCIPKPKPEAIADAIASLITDRAKAKRMGAEGRRRAVERFESKRTAERTLDVYRRVMEKR